MIRAAWLAVPATAVAACLSVMAGWQRGGELPERVLWVAVGVVLVGSAHLLPALCRSCPPAMRWIGAALWVGCMAATCYGHATFFLMAQQHAGEARAAAVTDSAPAMQVPTGDRSLTAIAFDRAAIVGRLARVAAPAARATLTARLDALDVEATEARRQEVAEDHATAIEDRKRAARDALRADPVTSRLAALLGTGEPRIDLFTGMAFAAVLEGVACFCWLLALGSGKQPHERRCEINPMNAVGETNPMNDHAADSQPLDIKTREPLTPVVTEAVTGDRERVAAEIAAGRVRCTVADIRRYLGCSQTRALELRRELAMQEG